MQDLYIDRLGNLSVTQGVARIDFLRLDSIDPEKKQAHFSPSLRVVMPLDAFMQMADQIHQVRENIIQQTKSQGQPPAANEPTA